MTYYYFEGYFEELKKLLKEKEKLLELKDRSICPLCNSNVSRKETNEGLGKINEALEELEIKKRKYNNKINEVN